MRNNLRYEIVSLNGHEIRVVIDDSDTIWFTAVDVAKLLGYNHTPHMVRMLDKNEKHYFPMLTAGGWQKMNFIDSYGLIKCLIKTHNLSAIPWQEWLHNCIVTNDKSSQKSIH